MKGSEDRERFDELLVDRALFGLEGSAQSEFERLRARFPELDDGSLERAAAALALGMLRGIEPPPEDLARRLTERLGG